MVTYNLLTYNLLTFDICIFRILETKLFTIYIIYIIYIVIIIIIKSFYIASPCHLPKSPHLLATLKNTKCQK